MNDLQKARRPAGEPGGAGALFGAGGTTPNASSECSPIIAQAARGVKMFSKGICEPNPDGWACWGWHVVDADGRRLGTGGGCLGYGAGMTANRAAYRAAIEALKWAAGAGLSDVILCSDNKLVVCQGMGDWACNSSALFPLLAELRSWMAETSALLEWIPKERNQIADQIARNAWGDATRDAQRRLESERAAS